MKGSATSEGQNDNFFFRTKVFSKRQQHCLSLSCMNAKNGDAAVTITTKNKVGVRPSRYRSKSIDGLTKGKNDAKQTTKISFLSVLTDHVVHTTEFAENTSLRGKWIPQGSYHAAIEPDRLDHLEGPVGGKKIRVALTSWTFRKKVWWNEVYHLRRKVQANTIPRISWLHNDVMWNVTLTKLECVLRIGSIQKMASRSISGKL